MMNHKYYGWCNTCVNRAGCRLFRELPNGVNCERCINVFNLNPRPPKPEVPTVPKKTLQRAKAKGVERPEKKLLREEEDKLIEWWKTNETGFCWRDKASVDLGIPKERLMYIARRLQRKGKACLKTLDELLLQKLGSEPVDAYTVASQLPNFTLETIYQKLEMMSKDGLVLRIKNHPYKNKYYLPSDTTQYQ